MRTKMIKAINIEGNTAYAPMLFSNMEPEILKLLEQAGCTNIETFEVGKMPLDKLPEEVQQKVKRILKAFRRCNVIYEYGEFHVFTGYCIKAKYNFDHFACGEYKADEVYTAEERYQNYIEVFGN